MTNAIDNYRAIVTDVTPAQIESAVTWYTDAQLIATEMLYLFADRDIDTTIEHTACVISAFSPRQRWSTNVAHAISFANGVDPKCLGNNLRMAKAAMIDGFDALRGQKTNAFARAIAGDEDAVTIDVWMLKAAGLERNDTNKSIYAELSSAVTTVADEIGLSPRATQALIWIMYRGGAA